jgi:hypothetical protein
MMTSHRLQWQRVGSAWSCNTKWSANSCDDVCLRELTDLLRLVDRTSSCVNKDKLHWIQSLIVDLIRRAKSHDLDILFHSDLAGQSLDVLLQPRAKSEHMFPCSVNRDAADVVPGLPHELHTEATSARGGDVLDTASPHQYYTPTANKRCTSRKVFQSSNLQSMVLPSSRDTVFSLLALSFHCVSDQMLIVEPVLFRMRYGALLPRASLSMASPFALNVLIMSIASSTNVVLMLRSTRSSADILTAKLDVELAFEI